MLQKIKNLNLASFVVGVLFIALLIPTIVSSYILINQERQNQLQELNKFTQSISKLLAASLAIPLWEFRTDSAMKAIEPILKDNRLVFVRVKDIQTDELFINIDNKNNLENIIIHTEPIYNDTNKIGELSIGVSDFVMQKELQKTINSYITLLLFQLLISIAILLIAIYSKILSPINRLTTQAKKLSQNDLNSSFEWKIEDEIGKLGKSFEFARQSLLKNLEQIKTQKESLSNIIDGTNVGTWEWNIQTGEAIFNERWAQMIGYSLAELQPISFETWTNFAHPSDLKKSSILLQKHLDGKSDFYECEARVKHKNGSWIWILDRGRVSKRDKDKKPLIMSGTHQDITEQKRAQKALEIAKTKAEVANKAKSQFLANMSHEIRTPMNAVTGLSEMLGLTELKEEQKELVTKINSSSKILLGIINDILDYSKIEAGKLELEHKEFLIRNLQISLETLFAQRANQKSIQIDFKFDKDLPYSVLTDELRLTQILTNLTSNALKFTDSGQVNLHVKLMNKVSANKALISFCVKDSGIGMSQSQLQKLFEPFTQADTSTTRKFGGTGLGLVITKNIIQALGGKLNIETKEGIGTKASFELKLEVGEWLAKKEHKTPSKQTANEDKSLAGTKVLLVEDNETNQMVATLMLENAKIQVDIANNGKEAVEKYMQNPNYYHLILMDLQMPIMSGYEATKEIRKLDKGIPIIALTAAAMIEDKQKAMKAGMNEHLSKPINKSELYKIISNFTDTKVQSKEQLPSQESSGIIDFSVLDSITDSKEFRLNLLEKFQTQLIDGDFKDILLHVKSGSNQARELIHTLKGVSGNLGAKELYNATVELDKKYKQKMQISQQDYQDLQTAINNFLNYLKTQGRTNAEEIKSKTLSQKELQALIDKTKESIEESNFIPRDELKLLLDNLQDKIPQESLAKFQNHLDEFNFDAALEIFYQWEKSGFPTP